MTTLRIIAWTSWIFLGSFEAAGQYCSDQPATTTQVGSLTYSSSQTVDGATYIPKPGKNPSIDEGLR